ncbi:MAG: hypothetical protein H6816_16170 [Phycisphaerales bacterium]|nr:hypothetical protein [Phycisphaerales bacterium]
MSDSTNTATETVAPPPERWGKWAAVAGAGTLAITLALLLVGIPARWAAGTAPENAVALAELNPSGPTDEIIALFVEASDKAVRDPDKHYEAAIALQAAGQPGVAAEHLQLAVSGYYWPHTSYPTLFSNRHRARIADANWRLGQSLLAGNESARGITSLLYARAIAPGVPREATHPDLESNPVAAFRARNISQRKRDGVETDALERLDQAFSLQANGDCTAALALAESQGWQRLPGVEVAPGQEARSNDPDNFFLYGRNESITLRVHCEAPVNAGELVVLAAGTRAAGIGPIVAVSTSHDQNDLLYIDTLDFRPHPLALALPVGTTDITFTFLNDASETAFLTEPERASADRRLIDRNVQFANLWIQREGEEP